MPVGDHVFRHLPDLRELMTPLDQSAMRFSQSKLTEFDAKAEAEGWPAGWRVSNEVREANRQSTLAGRLDQDLWVLAYGSLIWDPAVIVEECRLGALIGWHRSFCMHIEGGRASPETPGLMAALDEGGFCLGVALRIPAKLVDQETEYMWRREMFSGTYRPVFRAVTTPQGPVEALTFVMDRTNIRYVTDLTETEAARRIATAVGQRGTNFEYLISLIQSLAALSIEDEDMERLHALACEYRSEAPEDLRRAS